MIKNITCSLGLSCLMMVNAHSEMALDEGLAEQFIKNYGVGFANLEHRALGDKVTLKWPADFVKTNPGKLALPNGLLVSYGEVVMFAGDMFGNADHSIAMCEEKDKSACFNEQFAALAIKTSIPETSCSNPKTQVYQIRKYMAHLGGELHQARQKGIEYWEYYKTNSFKIAKRLNALTCGGSTVSELFPFGNYIKLANVNFDHFLPDSAAAYKIGHHEALETALKAHEAYHQGNKNKALSLLQLAYAKNAFANHYLSDSFSSGHIRTPRSQIYENTYLPALFQLILANLMHDEDNKYGLTVMNARGDVWKTYGDGRLTMHEARIQKALMQESMQLSADGVYNVFLSGVIPESYPEMAIIPLADSVDLFEQTAPLFKMDNGVLLKRKNNKDPYNYEWTAYWSGMLTLMRFYLT